MKIWRYFEQSLEKFTKMPEISWYELFMELIFQTLFTDIPVLKTLRNLKNIYEIFEIFLEKEFFFL